eukprot:Blabericola_migrator_1__5390@NODE_2760_length_2381_cov_53_684529_g1728_i0_p1_GENE_NODE_2760_length_2381_cov_53_684529_g1728_i0NODE_2760_length_2381_cov_53_684529_g1728_i0_p1_ORF_typecomplete_len212_score37_89_NODE_2760_length_2381_cov_53_684529_g1728_i06541289
MSARAANMFVRQAQQRRVKPSDATKSRLFFTGVLTAMTNGNIGEDTAIGTANGESSEPKIWQTGVYDWASEINLNGRPYIMRLIDRDLVEYDPDIRGLTSSVTESTVYNVQDIEDLVALNRFLDGKILVGKGVDPDTGETDQRKHELASQFLDGCGKRVQNSPTEQIAVKRLQHWIAVKLHHVRILQNPHRYYEEAPRIRKAYERCLLGMP